MENMIEVFVTHVMGHLFFCWDVKCDRSDPGGLFFEMFTENYQKVVVKVVKWEENTENRSPNRALWIITYRIRTFEWSIIKIAFSLFQYSSLLRLFCWLNEEESFKCRFSLKLLCFNIMTIGFVQWLSAQPSSTAELFQRKCDF